MHPPLRPVQRVLVLVLAAILAGGSLASVLASQACRHMARHHAMQHGAANAPCWCDQMTGGGSTLQPVVEALPAAIPVVIATAPLSTPDRDAAMAMPASPTFAPAPPPPNGRPS